MKNFYANDITTFQGYLQNCNDTDFALDLTSLNIFDSLKFMVLSSVYFHQKYPKDKLKCRVCSDDVKALISTFDIKNLEFVS
jgi:ABC-type transporter Mla MlaB component